MSKTSFSDAESLLGLRILLKPTFDIVGALPRELALEVKI
jgi:hypothetical protein